jgi:signal transduction histidine kinase
VAAGVAALFTLVVSVAPLPDFAYRSPTLHAAAETAAAGISLLAALLIYGRFRHTLQLRDLLLTAALVTAAAAELLFSAIPAIAELGPSRFAGWAPIPARLLAAWLFAAAAVVPNRELRRAGHDARLLLGACALVLAGVAVGVVALGDALPVALAPDPVPGAAGHFHIVGHPAVVGAHLTTVLVMTIAAVGFTRRAEASDDALTRWLAIAATLLAFAGLNFLLFPSLSSHYFYMGDILRLGFYLALFVGGLVELRRVQEVLSTAAVLEERHRIAREIHDDVVQDLAFILQYGRRLAARPEASSDIRNIVVAAGRALDGCRHAIASLVRSGGDPLTDALALTAQEAAGREGGVVELRVDGDVSVPAATQDALLRVVREAITNAIRHGGAHRITVELSEQPHVRLSVIDDGGGFDVPASAAAPGRLGLRSIEARVRAVGGELRIESEPGRGTRVEVRLP